MFIGAHQSIAGGIYKSIERAVADSCESLQVFVKNSNRWVGKVLTSDEIERFKALASDFGKEKICAHASYLINLASPDIQMYQKSIDGMCEELERCTKLGIKYYVIHPGSHLREGEKKGIYRIMEALDTVYSNNNFNTVTLLETTAGQGTNLGYKLEHIKDIISGSSAKDKLGICLDSCHMFSAGYDIVGNYETVMQRVFDMFEEKVKVIHINDSKKEFGSRLDRHERIGKGTIKIGFFDKLVNDKRFDNILGVLETPLNKGESYLDEVNILKKLRNKKNL